MANIITVTLKLKDEQFQRDLDSHGAKLASFGKKFAKGALVVGAAAIVGGKALAPFVNEAADLGESVNKAGAIFGDASPEIDAFAASAARAFGLSKREATDTASTFGQFGKAAGLTGRPLAEFATDLTGLTSDLGSFFNVGNDVAAQKIASGLAGETEPLRAFGIFLSAAAVEAKALELGLTGLNDPLTEQEKVLARSALIFEQTSDAAGDFGRTSDGLANQTKQLNAEWANMQAELGEKLLPIVVAVAAFMLDDMIPALREFATWLQVNIPAAIEATRSTWEPLVAMFQAGWQIVQGLFNVFAGFLTGDWSQAWEGVRQLLGGWVDGVIAQFTLFKNTALLIFGEVVNWFLGLGASVLNAIGDVASTLWQKGVDLITGLFNGIKIGWLLPFAFLLSLPVLAAGAIIGATFALWQKGADLMSGLWDGLKAVWAQIAAWLGGLKDQVVDAFTGAIAGAIKTIPGGGFALDAAGGAAGLAGSGLDIVSGGSGFSQIAAARQGPGTPVGGELAPLNLILDDQIIGKVMAQKIGDYADRSGGVSIKIRNSRVSPN